MDLERAAEEEAEEEAEGMVPQFTGACLPWFPFQGEPGRSEATEVPQGGRAHRSTPPWLTPLGFILVTFNSGIALYRSQDDPWATYFVCFSYVTTLLLSYLHNKMERASHPTNSRRIRSVRASVWTLTALLAIMFSYKAAAVLPLPMAAVVWVMSAAAVVGVFFAFFSHY
ncbi:uncharacterized protein C2845_PM11G01390 [Panicum miliaceum]|uniref:Uncharacterized protein n=1 Tax=Panicum miliaceum TaxID=4540 RepID=A0A3L6RW23_PANMI|nr:uncharacterized protein C2845_PM11G01390 [Panicum miliaceum]